MMEEALEFGSLLMISILPGLFLSFLSMHNACMQRSDNILTHTHYTVFNWCDIISYPNLVKKLAVLVSSKSPKLYKKSYDEKKAV